MERRGLLPIPGERSIALRRELSSVGPGARFPRFEMRNPILHALNIGTLALWLSVAGFGAVALYVPRFTPEITQEKKEETTVVVEDLTLGEVGESTASEAPTDTGGEESIDPVETLPSPPELPSLSEISPLPEIPDLPAPVEKPSPAPEKPRTTSRPASAPAARPAAANPGKPAGKPSSAVSGKPAGGMSTAARLAAGRMPAPSYPPYSRRNNQTGTVAVQFTVDENGRVIAASVYKSSNWPLLDREALRTVRTWKFPPGDVMTHIKPIRFNLE